MNSIRIDCPIACEWAKSKTRFTAWGISQCKLQHFMFVYANYQRILKNKVWILFLWNWMCNRSWKATDSSLLDVDCDESPLYRIWYIYWMRLKFSMADQRSVTTTDKLPYGPFVEEIEYDEIEHIDVSRSDYGGNVSWPWLLNFALSSFQVVGKGAFGTVYKAKWRSNFVAVKYIEQEKDRDAFTVEVNRRLINSFPFHNFNTLRLFPGPSIVPSGSSKYYCIIRCMHKTTACLSCDGVCRRWFSI